MLSRFELRLSFKVDVARKQDALIDIVVKGSFTEIDLRMVTENDIRRLSLFKKRLDGNTEFCYSY